ncbi:acyl-CoA dehydrogenase domain protein [Paenibacillus curdlanolyticus YK9]|uniref:Acyl-CoA dehydrogenase domain protein n=1 Tax=Paenibacillus curdlanolyticus YK9 TaxID=717606 RepID=E0I7E8_9BACL|nr:acyl-CoA dehydrogenase family protein [Paenibacillus curdlanolyticus]EFM11964.1 acyl-CoA dehydrogenase domain protein [Paenibacillus curdlanolyticus YK9]
MTNATAYDHDVLKEETEAFVAREVLPIAAAIDKEGKIPLALIRAMGEHHYLAPFIPRIYGGAEQDMIAVGIVNEIFGTACSSVRGILTVQGMVAMAIWRWGTEEQRRKWLPLLESGEAVGAFGLSETSAGTDAQSLETKAVRNGDSFLLQGTKKWISLGQLADIYLIFAKCEGQISLFLVERNTPGLTVEPIPPLAGLRGSMLAELRLEQCRVREDSLVGSIGTGLSMIGLFCLDYGRYTVAWGCVGIARSCIEHALAYAASRNQFGSQLSEFQLIQKMITEMVVGLEAARLLCLEAGRMRDEGDPDSIMETWKAKYFASKLVVETAGKSVQIHGASGLVQGTPVERHYRDAKVYEIIEGTSQVHEIFIAQHAFQTMHS